MTSLSLPPDHPKFPAVPVLHAICAVGSLYTSAVTSAPPVNFDKVPAGTLNFFCLPKDGLKSDHRSRRNIHGALSDKGESTRLICRTTSYACQRGASTYGNNGTRAHSSIAKFVTCVDIVTVQLTHCVGTILLSWYYCSNARCVSLDESCSSCLLANLLHSWAEVPHHFS